MHQQSTHVDIAAFADSQLPDPATRACLLGNQAEPCCELSAVLERGGLTHGCNDRGSRHQANSRNVRQCLAGNRLTQVFCQTSLDGGDVALQVVDSPDLLIQAIDEHRR